jgi:dTMP kinase
VDLDNSIVLDNFVVLEGLDGAGTTTQLTLLDQRLSAERVPHFCTGEPTGETIGRQIRAILRRESGADPRTVALLFAADRNEHLLKPETGILVRLRRGELVISDRYLFSSLAYQALACPFEYVRELNRPFPLPQLLLYFDTPVVLSQERLSRRQAAGVRAAAPSKASSTASGPAGQSPLQGMTRELFDAAEIQQDILAAYERSFSLFASSGMKLHRIDGSLGVQEVFEKVWNILRGLPILRR